MYNLLIKVALSILVKLATEKVASEVGVNILNSLATKTTNKLDDKIVKTVADALNVKV
jgi:hypothetical protein